MTAKNSVSVRKGFRLGISSINGRVLAGPARIADDSMGMVEAKHDATRKFYGVYDVNEDFYSVLLQTAKMDDGRTEGSFHIRANGENTGESTYVVTIKRVQAP